MPLENLKWWQKAVFYQIYPRSFADSSGDGIGDLPGIISRLDYLQDLGVSAIWLSPHYPSPLYDVGYDVANYREVAPEYGNLELFQEFLEGAHQRGMGLILDLVLNHTSYLHPWFLDSRSSLDNPKRDWYIWRDGKNGRPPNNWYSSFGGSAWEFDPQTGQYYYHFFFKEQPDLNWRNPEVKEALFNDARFWLDMGVDGFRLDAIGTLFEDPDLTDQTAGLTLTELRRRILNTGNMGGIPSVTAQLTEERKKLAILWKKMFEHQVEQPGVHQVFQDLRALIDTYDDRVLVGETDKLEYYGNGHNELHMVFNFPLMRVEKLTPELIRANQKDRLDTLAEISPDAWPCNTLGNHDSPRVYSHFGDGVHDEALARLSLALMLTLRGTPFLYNGEEIGMSDLMLTDISQFRDLLGIWLYYSETEDLGVPPDLAFEHAAELTRDKNRTPMQWANAPNAGFSPPDVETWLPVNPNYQQGVNIAEQQPQPDSLINFYRQMLHLRNETPALIGGDYQTVLAAEPGILAFLRSLPEQTCLVILNYADHPQTIAVSKDVVLAEHLQDSRLQVLFSSHQRPPERPGSIVLDPFGIYVAELRPGGQQ